MFLRINVQEVMMRKKSALHLDARYNTMIENAFYYCNPPEYKREEAKQRPPQHEYIRRLLYRDLNKVTTERVRIETSTSDRHHEVFIGLEVMCSMMFGGGVSL